MEERIAAVWELTLECLAWSDPDAIERGVRATDASQWAVASKNLHKWLEM
jgi:hypothetical protein